MQKPIAKKEQTVLRKICRMACVLLILFCSCSSSKHNYKKRHRAAPCDCPKFNYAPQNEFGRDVTYCISITPFGIPILNSQFSIFNSPFSILNS